MIDVRHWTAESMAGGEAYLVRVGAGDMATLARDLPAGVDPPHRGEPTPRAETAPRDERTAYLRVASSRGCQM